MAMEELNYQSLLNKLTDHSRKVRIRAIIPLSDGSMSCFRVFKVEDS